MRKIGWAVVIASLSSSLALAAGPKPNRANTGTPVPLARVGAGQCQAMAPRGWRVVDIDPRSSIISLSSPSGDMRAVYGAVGIGSGQASGVYGPQFRTPFALASYLTGVTFGGQPVSRGSQAVPHGFQMINWGTMNGFSGYTLFKAYPLYGDPGGYVLSVYIGGGSSANVKRSVPMAMAVATTIQCATQFTPPPPNDFHPSRGARCFGSECSERDAASSDANAILGTRYVHDPNTGEGFYVSNDAWEENGPQGPGFYKRNGNDVTKLADGL